MTIMTPKNLPIIYDQLYDEADKLFKKYNYCDIKDNTCYQARRCGCISFCCKRCEYLSDNGCTVKSLTCKLWICGGKKMPSEFWQTRMRLYSVANSYKFLIYRGSKEDSLNNAKMRMQKM